MKSSLFLRFFLCLFFISSVAYSQSNPAKYPPLVEGAYQQIGQTTLYDPSYVSLAYPGGDVPIERGVCSDVVVRAFRKSGVDLQALVHEDMKKHFSAYPNLWGLKGPDTNIDHRRVPNLMTYLKRMGKELPITQEAKDYQPGDIVVWRLPNGLLHTGIVISEKAEGGSRPLIIHNIGVGAQKEDVLFEFEIKGHYRY